MIQRRFKIKDGILFETTVKKIEDYSQLLKYNMNLKMLKNDIRRSRKDKQFEKFLLMAEKLFDEEIWNAKVLKKPVLGNHSIFYYFYGHMNDWVRYEETRYVQAKAILAAVYHLEETVNIISNSHDVKAAKESLMNYLGIDEVGAKSITSLTLHQLKSISLEDLEPIVNIELEYRLFAVKELAKYDKMNK